MLHSATRSTVADIGCLAPWYCNTNGGARHSRVLTQYSITRMGEAQGGQEGPLSMLSSFVTTDCLPFVVVVGMIRIWGGVQ